MKIAHIVYQSLPNISGSSIRTRDLLMSQKEIGLSPFVISSPFQNGVAEDSDIDVINGIIHHRTYNNNENHLVSEGVSGFKKKTSKFITVYKFSPFTHSGRQKFLVKHWNFNFSGQLSRWVYNFFQFKRCGFRS